VAPAVAVRARPVFGGTLFPVRVLWTVALSVAKARAQIIQNVVGTVRPIVAITAVKQVQPRQTPQLRPLLRVARRWKV
jgi:hypothetical protein